MMKILAAIAPAVVALMLTTGPAVACSASVVNHPLLNETIVYTCYTSNLTEVEKQESRIAKDTARIEPKKTTASKRKYKKRCWYTNKRGQKRYRMRYKC